MAWQWQWLVDVGWLVGGLGWVGLGWVGWWVGWLASDTFLFSSISS